MAKTFDTWTVLPHDPIQKLTENLWTVEGTMPDGRTRRVMALAKFRDGRLVVHNGVALGDAEMAEVEAFGSPEVLVVPNGFHRQDARIFKNRYPKMRVLAPQKARKKVEQVVKTDGGYGDAPEDADVSLFDLEGVGQSEGVLRVRSSDGVTLVFNDMVMNQPKLGGVIGFALAPTGCVSVPRVMRWFMVKDKRALRTHLETLAALPDLRRVVVAHGKMITENPGDALRAAAATL